MGELSEFFIFDTRNYFFIPSFPKKCEIILNFTGNVESFVLSYKLTSSQAFLRRTSLRRAL